MKRITCYSNWCEFDQLDGVTLKDKEKLKLKFPNKTITVKITVSKGSDPYNDMGRLMSMPTSKAFVKIKVLGKLVTIPIVGLMAERVK